MWFVWEDGWFVKISQVSFLQKLLGIQRDMDQLWDGMQGMKENVNYNLSEKSPKSVGVRAQIRAT